MNYGRGLDIKPISPTSFEYDSVRHDLFDVIDSVKFKHRYSDKASMRVECPVCTYPTGIFLIDIKGKPQERECSWCHNVSIFVQTHFGNWKIKSILGNERIDDRGKTKVK